METSRRSFLLGSVSMAALVAAGWPLVRPGHPPADPSLDAMTRAVRAIMDLINRPGLIGLDFCDIDAVVLRGGGRGVCGIGEASGPNRARLAAERALAEVIQRNPNQ